MTRRHRPFAVLAALTLVAASAAAQVDRTRAPELPPLPPLRLPNAQTFQLGNGLEVVLVEMHETPVVDFTLVVRAGAANDPADLPGLATFTANMLDEGAGGRGALAIADEADYLGADLSTSAGLEHAQVSLHVPKRQLGPALELMADVALEPAFSDSEIVRQRDLRKTGLLQLRDQPTAIAPIAFAAIVMGPGHPYGHPSGGDDAAAERLSREPVLEFYRTWYRPNNATLLVVGDVTAKELRALATRHFGGWSRGDVPAPPAGEPPRRGARSFYLVDKPGAAQSVIRIGHPGVARSTPDYFPLLVMNTILGGSFTSRLNQNLRETHGYTYGAGSSFDMRRLAGPFVATASVVTAKTDSSLIEFFRELRAIRATPPPADEIEKAKAYLALGLPSRFETTSDAAGMYLDLVINRLPLDTYASYIPKVQAVTAADVQRVAHAHVNPDQFAVVVVGDRKEIETRIQALGEGSIEVRDLWGKPVSGGGAVGKAP